MGLSYVPASKWPRTKLFMPWKRAKIHFVFFFDFFSGGGGWEIRKWEKLFGTLLWRRACHSIGETMQTNILLPFYPYSSHLNQYRFLRQIWMSKRTSIACGREGSSLLRRRSYGFVTQSFLPTNVCFNQYPLPFRRTGQSPAVSHFL